MSGPSLPSPTTSPGRAARVKPNATRQIVWLTVGAIALYVGIRQLPTGTNLSHLDFRVAGGNSIEFCDPANPQFIPVVAVRSPVSMNVTPLNGAPQQGRRVQAVATLATASGKPIAPPDLLLAHTEKLHLLIFDPELRDYQHVHPSPGKTDGEWAFTFVPHRLGKYRVFADFTPAATGRGLYASADLDVLEGNDKSTTTIANEREPAGAEGKTGAGDVVQDGLIFRLKPAVLPLKSRVMSDFEFSVVRQDGAAVQLQPVMDAFAHLVAIDRERSGFAHLHPAQLVPADGETAAYSNLQFKVLIPKAGRYVIWSQVRVEGREYYVPFWFEVVNG